MVTQENGPSKPVEANILKRLIKKFEPKLTREEKLDVLRRLFRKYSTSPLTKLETINILKRFIARLSAIGSVGASEDMKDEDKR